MVHTTPPKPIATINRPGQIPEANRLSKGMRRAANRGSAPKDSEITYNGPIRMYPLAVDHDQVTLCEILPVVLTSGVAYTSFVSANPAFASGFSDWADIFSEYRTLGMSVQFIPNYANSFTGGNSIPLAPWVTVVDHDSTNLAVTLTLADAEKYSTLEVSPANQAWTRIAKMMSVEEANYLPSAVASSNPDLYGVKYLIETIGGAATAAAFGYLVVYRNVEFRTRTG